MSREIVYHTDNAQARALNELHNVSGVSLPNFHDQLAIGFEMGTGANRYPLEDVQATRPSV
jgi:hypothetical protein